MTLPARTPAEICAVYLLHPEFRDLYVEGFEDVRFWRWLIRVTIEPSSRIGVYPAVAISASSPTEASNHKARIITLARTAARVLGPTQSNITCCVDLDFDDIENLRVHLSCLIYTEATSLETEFWRPPYLDKFLGLVCRLDNIDVNDFSNNMGQILRTVAAFRLANERLGLRLPEVSFEKDLELLRDFTIEFDETSFVSRYLNKGNRMSAMAEFRQAAEMTRADLPSEDSRSVRGHDFVAFLGWFQLRAVDEVRQNDEVARWLYALADPLIGTESPFCLVLARLKT